MKKMQEKTVKISEGRVTLVRNWLNVPYHLTWSYKILLAQRHGQLFTHCQWQLCATEQ